MKVSKINKLGTLKKFKTRFGKIPNKIIKIAKGMRIVNSLGFTS